MKRLLIKCPIEKAIRENSLTQEEESINNEKYKDFYISEDNNDYVEYMDCEYQDFFQSGYLNIKWNDEKKYFESIVEYIVTDGKELTSDVIEYVLDYTSGQNSDGIGEGFEQFECGFIDEDPVFISPGYKNMEYEIINV